MSTHRHVVLGLARARSPWFADVTRWATSGVLAVDFVKTVSADEVRSRIASGRPFSALLVDGFMPGLDRDLVDVARDHGVVTVVVSDDSARDWSALGAAATIPTQPTADDVSAVLAAHSIPIDQLDTVPGAPVPAPPLPQPNGGFRSQVVSVTGAPGAGRSTVAAALAQGLADDPAHSGTALLVDLALDADQGPLHDAGDIIPGLLELVERHRTGACTADAVRSMTFDIVDRRYRLLLGLRHHRDWTALRPGPTTAAIDALRRAFTVLVADIDDDFEGEAETGSIDVEERNLLARSALAVSDVVVVVGSAGVGGIRALLRSARRCLDAGFPASGLVPVVHGVARRRRAETVRAVNELLARHAGNTPTLSPLVLPHRAETELAIRDVNRLPDQITRPLATAVRSRLEAAHPASVAAYPTAEPVPVAVGSLGEWFEEEDR